MRALKLVIVIGLIGVGVLFAIQAGLWSNTPELDELTKRLATRSEKLVPFHKKMGSVQPGDWLASHREPGQTFAQYVAGRPIRLSKKRNTLYVLPLGEFNEHQRKIVELSADFLGRYFMCQVKTLETLSLEKAKIPESARRVHPSWGVRQIRSTYVLDDVLRPRLPKDAVALIAFTTSDLYPADDWNFVFGQASLRHRVGVWSIFRNGDAETEFKTCLLRTIKTASHETGHMFSIQHCIAYECNMCGSNNRSESDRRPVYLCPNCVAKVWYATKCDPAQRFDQLAEFCADHEFQSEAEFYKRSASRLRQTATNGQNEKDKQ